MLSRFRISALLVVFLTCSGLDAADKLYQVDRVIGKDWTWQKRLEPGFFLRPQAITLDRKGNLYVVDRENNRVQAFRPDGTHFMTFGKPWEVQWGVARETGPDYLRTPYGVAVAGDSVYVTDWGKHRIVRFGMDGKGVDQLGGETAEHAALYYPSAIFADPAGKLYVGHEKKDNSDRTQPIVFDLDGKFIEYTSLSGGNGFAKAPDGSLFQTYQSRVYKIGADGKLIGWIGRSHLPLHPEVAEQPGQWIPASETYPNGAQGGRWCSAGSGPSEFRGPTALAVDPERKRLFVCDTMNHRVQILDLDGTYIGVIGERGKEEGQFLCPSGIAVSGSGEVYVSDKYNNRVQVLKPVE